MKKTVFALLVLALSASPCRAAGLKLSIGNGKVSIDAQDVTIRQILTEWARVGKTRIVNLEAVASGPITLKLDNVPEAQALDIILRTVPGYISGTRASYVADASVYDRILIVATTTAVRASTTQAPSPYQQAFQPPPNVTQLRPFPGVSPGPGLTPGIVMESDVGDQQDDQAIASAAAAGLIMAPAPPPGATMLNPGMLQAPFTTGQPAQPSTPATATPSNPWNVPAGTALPGLAPPVPPATPPGMIRRPPQADR